MEEKVYKITRSLGQFRGTKTEYLFEHVEDSVECKYAMQILYSDVYPFEILEVKGKKIKIRSMDTENIKAPEMIPGGFAGHCPNVRDQKWKITSNPKGQELWISLRKDGRYYQVGSSMGHHQVHYNLSDVPYHFYDYNF